MSAKLGDDLAIRAAQVVNRRADHDVDLDSIRLLNHLNPRTRLRGKKLPPVTAHGRQTSLAPLRVHRRIIAVPEVRELPLPSLFSHASQ